LINTLDEKFVLESLRDNRIYKNKLI